MVMRLKKCTRGIYVLCLVLGYVISSRGSSCSDRDETCEAEDIWVSDIDYNVLWKDALGYAKSGELTKCIPLFKEYLKHKPQSPQAWCNYALAVRQLASSGLNNKKKKRALRESIMAYDIAWTISPGDQGCLEGYSGTIMWIKHLFPEEKEPFSTGDRLLDTAMGVLRQSRNTRDDMEHVINLVCSNELSTSIKLRLVDGRVSTRTMRRLVIVYMLCGVLKIEGLYTIEFIEELNEHISPLVDDFLNDISIDESLINTTTSAQRSQLRYEVNLPLEYPFNSEQLIANDVLLQIVKCLISERVEIDTLTYVVSKPSAPNQHWHSDVGDPFQEFYRNSFSFTPSHGFVLFVPTDDVSLLKGPTEMALGSHVLKDKEDLNRRMVSQKGDCVIFDLRISHRGTANQSSSNRSIMYISYVREWFFDRVNFRDIQTRNFDSLPSSALRKLLSRKDARNYPIKLQQRILQVNGTYDDITSFKYASSSHDVFKETI